MKGSGQGETGAAARPWDARRVGEKMLTAEGDGRGAVASGKDACQDSRYP